MNSRSSEYSKPPDIDFSQFAGSVRSFDSKMADHQKPRAAKYRDGSVLSLENKKSN